jgi:D-alanyl-D-alanine carboxypeptidase/D-alanyl-D-alanine-endopeptidase (penicillin-binding protein 4)
VFNFRVCGSLLRVVGLAFLVHQPWVLGAEVSVQSLPRDVVKGFEKQGVSSSDFSVYVYPMGGNKNSSRSAYAYAANQLMNPASVTKVFTTGLALNQLSSTYRFKTAFQVDRAPVDGVLQGNLYIKGSGDPGLDTNDIWGALRALRAKGLKTIQGNVVLDDSVFADQGVGLRSDGGLSDESPYRAYHAQPYGLLINHGAMMLQFSVNQGAVQIRAEDAPQNWAFVSEVKGVSGACGAWKNGLDVGFEKRGGNVLVTVRGTYPKACGTSPLPVRVPDQDWLWESWVREIWHQLGGDFTGQVVHGRSPSNASLFYELEGKTLGEHIRLVNKWSNNVMARHLELAVAPRVFNEKMQEWLKSLGLHTKDWFFENGSGLSRSTRVDAAGVTQFLRAMSERADFPEYLASLPQAGTDGTLQHRAKNVEGHAYLKTGSLNGVRAVAGYVRDAEGRWWTVAVFIRGEKAAESWPAIEKVLEFVYRGR